ncbi:uncharacterized protein LOC121372317 [Gigantopelta aegis]|uniref:uncharacterized protein LOC121372317 n=1 Tax=Gigantopelta aegis TaxID=1735272 RepID=UPI001B88D180|nr:uncharacterized protein LOC121372317 [Gigantopelta aegis]
MAGGIMASFKAATLMKKIAFIILLVAVVCNFTAFTTTGWGYKYTDQSKQTYSAYGLWRICPNTNPITAGCASMDGIAVTWMAISQTFAVFGFVGIDVVLLVVTLQIFSSKCNGLKDLNIFNAIYCFITALCWLIAVGVYGAFFDSVTYYTNPNTSNAVDPDLGYAFGFAVVALLLELVVGVLLLLDGRLKTGGVSQQSQQSQQPC